MPAWLPVTGDATTVMTGNQPQDRKVLTSAQTVLKLRGQHRELVLGHSTTADT